jgi:acetolactate synthase-1/2/3 large subunit
MADMYGRLTQRAGVCLGTLGPGATNLITAVADAFLDRSPLVALTGQGDLERMHKESHQYIDVVSMMKPVTKWNARLTHQRIIPEVVRKAFKVAQAQKPGPTHIELPEDVMAATVDGEPLPARTTLRRPEPSAQELLKAVDVIRGAINPVVLAGNGVARVGAAPALREFARATGIGVAETFMGKGLLSYDDPRYLGTVGLQSRDYTLAGFEGADVVITVGYDLVEHAPSHWNPERDKTIVCIDTVAPEVDAHYITEVDLVGDIYHILSRLAEELRTAPHQTPESRLNDIVLGRFEAARDDDQFPRCGTSARRCGRRTSWCPTSASTSCGSPACSPRGSRTRSSSPTAWPAWGSRSRPRSRPSSSTRSATSSRSTATAASS